MIPSSLNLIVLLIAWITIFSLTSSVSGFGTFTHNETNSYETSPLLYQYGKYIDGTVVIRIINRNPYKPSNSTEWLRPVLSLRIIHPNGTDNEIDKDLEIQEFNWQIFSIAGVNQSPISIYALQRGYLIVRYFKASNLDDITTYEEWGRIIDWNSNLYDEVNLGGAYIQGDEWFPSVTTIVPNIDPAKGFIRIAGGGNATHVEWQQYMIGDSFNLIKLQEGNITLPQDGNSVFNTIATVDEGYSIIMANSTFSINSSNPFEFYVTVYYFKIGYNETQSSAPAPKLLYQSNLLNVTVFSMNCDISSSGIGQVCTLTITQNDTFYYVKLDFLISGSVTKITPLNNLPELPSNFTTGWLTESIPYGGYLIYGYFLNATTNQINTYGFYYDEIENKFQGWEFPEPSVLNDRGILLTLPNNTLLVSQIESNNTWSFLTTDIPNYSGNPDHGYSNLLVDSTYPSINVSIPNISNLTDMGNIRITYYLPVELSDRNIWIYRIDDSSNNNVTRQFVNGNNDEFCSISDNGLTVTIKVIRSTFSDPNSQFYVKVDNNFVRSKVYGEPLMGINDNIWNFYTNSNVEIYAGTDTVSGVMRLTAEGTEYYENLLSIGKDQFFTDLHLELSKIIPVNIKRLSSNKKTQVDNTLPNRQIFISLNIQSSDIEKSVKSIIDDLNDMIKYKSITSISLFPTTKYLDEDFGFQPKQSFWVKYKWVFLGVIFALGILALLFFLASKKDSKPFHQQQCVILLTVPTVVKTVWAFYIIFDEKKSENFRNWFTKYVKVALIFAVLSGADIEALSILHSNIAGFEFFNAPFSPKGKNKIFWASCLYIFVEDIPQVIIQSVLVELVHKGFTVSDGAMDISCRGLTIQATMGRTVGLFQTINICRQRSLAIPANERNFTSDESRFSANERNFTSDESRVSDICQSIFI
ncbi:hypothetical protein Glove_221g77 [Diversispora epigaea]|uniref:Uncharacterized protein n=1 Tax=Diversispora epigaea TaxID=1348612 RepID=A0A397IPC8_9GLOM|nr:hypothetical protein Glove_221g77 [Diversispora epigaea]